MFGARRAVNAPVAECVNVARVSAAARAGVLVQRLSTTSSVPGHPGWLTKQRNASYGRLTGSRGSEGGFELLEQGSGDMAQRKGQKRAPARTRVESHSAGPESLDALRQERDRLRADLDAAKAENERLRELQAQVLNRIDWIVDSLNSLRDDEP